MFASQRSEPSSMLQSLTPGVEDDFFEAEFTVLVSFLGRSHVGFADDLGERHAGRLRSIAVFEAASAKPSCRLLPASSSRCRRVMPIFFFAAGRLTVVLTFVKVDFDESELRQRLVVLRDLVALRQVGIKIIFPRKDGNFVDAGTPKPSPPEPRIPQPSGSAPAKLPEVRDTLDTRSCWADRRNEWSMSKRFSTRSAVVRGLPSPMTGSYFASKSSETAGVVAISGDYNCLAGGAPGVLARPRCCRPWILSARERDGRGRPSLHRRTTAFTSPGAAARSSTSPSEFRNTSSSIFCRSRRGLPSDRSWRRPADSRCRRYRKTESPALWSAVPPP